MRSLLKNSARYTALFILFSGIFLIRYSINGQAIYGDGINYTSYLHSWVIDQDLQLRNEYQHIYSPANNNALTPLSSELPSFAIPGKDGNIMNPHLPGTAILLLPFYLMAHWISTVLSFAGFAFPTHGYADLYQIMTGLGSILYGVIGIALAVRFLEKILPYPSNQTLHQNAIFSSSTSWIAVLVLCLTTPLFYYLSFDVLNSHALSWFMSCLAWNLILFPWGGTRHREIRWHLVFGFVLSLAILIRPQLGSLILSWSILKTWQVWKLPRSLKEKAEILMVDFSTTAIPVVITLFLIGGLYLHLGGTTTSHAYLQPTGSVWSLESLTNLQQGLLSVHPAILVWIVASLMLLPATGAAGAVTFLDAGIQHLAIANHGGWIGASYGGRMYITIFPSLLAGIAVLIAGASYSFGTNDYFGADYSRGQSKKGDQKPRMILLGFLFITLVTASTQILSFHLLEKANEAGSRGIETRTLERIEQLW